jgi:hydroxyacylglutathione hydrolase
VLGPGGHHPVEPLGFQSDFGLSRLLGASQVCFKPRRQSWRVDEVPEASVIHCVTLTTPELGDRSYLLHNGEVGVAVDVQRDIGRMLSAAADAGVRIACVAETHIHNDYLSGGQALAELLDVSYLVAAEEKVSFRRLAVSDGDEVDIGPSFRLRVVATPGHTMHHVSYVALDEGRPVQVCSGGSLLYGTTGRTDLEGEELAAPLARAQFHSARRLVELGDDVLLLPTHGFGSLCAALGGDEGMARSSIGQQRATNLAFRLPDAEAFSLALLGALAPSPRYYAHMADLNRAGVPLADPTPPPALDLSRLHRFLAEGGWAVDLRPRVTFAAAHVAGTVNIEYGQSFTLYAGSVLPWPAPLALLADDAQTVVAAKRDLSRIGMDQAVGQMLAPVREVARRLCGTVAEMPRAAELCQASELRLASYPVAGRAELVAARRHPETLILDVRRLDEWQAGHLEEAVHVPLADLLFRLGDLPHSERGSRYIRRYDAGSAFSRQSTRQQARPLSRGATFPVLTTAAAGLALEGRRTRLAVLGGGLIWGRACKCGSAAGPSPAPPNGKWVYLLDLTCEWPS